MMLPLSLAPEHASAQAERTGGEIRRVVSLNAADPYLPAFVALDRGVRDAILAGRTAPTGFHAETLDMFRFPQSEIDDDVVALLRKKYRGLSVDVIVAASEIARQHCSSASRPTSAVSTISERTSPRRPSGSSRAVGDGSSRMRASSSVCAHRTPKLP
jgi:hypothetical protein